MGSKGTFITERPRRIKPKNWTLAQTEEYLRTLDHEEAYAFDRDGKMIGGVRGGRDSVGIPRDWLQMEGITVTHSHPVGASDFGGTLSIMSDRNGKAVGDIPVFAQTKWAEMRATARGRGEMNYILRQNANSRTKTFSNVMRGRLNTLEKNMRNVYKSTYDRVYKQTGSRASARRAARQRSVGVMDREYKRTASKYGVTYITRKTPHTF